VGGRAGGWEGARKLAPTRRRRAPRRAAAGQLCLLPIAIPGGPPPAAPCRASARPCRCGCCGTTWFCESRRNCPPRSALPAAARARARLRLSRRVAGRGWPAGLEEAGRGGDGARRGADCMARAGCDVRGTRGSCFDCAAGDQGPAALTAEGGADVGDVQRDSTLMDARGFRRAHWRRGRVLAAALALRRPRHGTRISGRGGPRRRGGRRAAHACRRQAAGAAGQRRRRGSGGGARRRRAAAARGAPRAGEARWQLRRRGRQQADARHAARPRLGAGGAGLGARGEREGRRGPC
jgi:hypothetical protein